MRTGVVFFSSLLLLCFLAPFGASQQPNLPGWDLGIEYPQEDEDNPFQLNAAGTTTISFFVANNELLPITVEFSYEIPFEGESDGPESETIGAGNNKTFSLVVMGITVRDIPAETTEEFSIVATLVARGSVPQPIPDSREGTGELQIPTIHSLEAIMSEPVGSMNSGSEMTLTLEIQNMGNVVDRVGSVGVSDNCPLLTTDNGLDSLTTRDIGIGAKVQASLIISASQSHPQRNCDIEVTVTSNGATNSGGSEIANDKVRVSIEPPPANQEDPDDPIDNGGTIDEVVSSNLPSPGILLSICVIFLASLTVRKSDH